MSDKGRDPDTVHVVFQSTARFIRPESAKKAAPPPAPKAEPPAPEKPRRKARRKKGGGEPTSWLDHAGSALALAGCCAVVALGVIGGRHALRDPAPEEPPPPETRAAGWSPNPSAAADEGPREQPGAESPATIWAGPLIKGPDGSWYVARSGDELGVQVKVDPRTASRIVTRDGEGFIALPRGVLVKAYPELLSEVAEGVKLRSGYSLASGRGTLPPQGRLTREQIEARVERRLEREQRTGELFGIDYGEKDELAEPKETEPVVGADGKVRADAPPDFGPPAGEASTPR